MSQKSYFLEQFTRLRGDMLSVQISSWYSLNKLSVSFVWDLCLVLFCFVYGKLRLLFKKIYFYLICKTVLPKCIYIHHICAWYPRRLEGDIGSPGARDTYGCETPDMGVES